MKRKYILIFVFCLPLLVPLVSFMLWWMQENKQLRILIYDITDLNKELDEHKSLSWVLINQKYTTSGQPDQPKNNFKGFFPLNYYEYTRKDLSKLTSEEVFHVADGLDMVYYTDTYGIYSNHGDNDSLISERSSQVNRGVSNNDLLLFRRFQDSGKLILTESNFLASPTTDSLREEAEKLFDVKWTGWIGRYYDPLDTLINKDIPVWARKLYKEQYGKSWDFHQPGILFAHKKDRIVVLEMDNTLNEEIPWVYSSEYGEQKYGLPQEITYPLWFDVMQSGESNRILSKYKIYANASGKKLMDDNGIPDVFPCVIENREKNYYYFAGNFCDSPIDIESAMLKGVSIFHRFFYDKYNYVDRSPFFWHFFRPMVTNILDDYHTQLKKKRESAILVGPKSH